MTTLNTVSKIIEANPIYHGTPVTNALPNGNLSLNHDNLYEYTSVSGYTIYNTRFLDSNIYGQIHIHAGTGTQVIPSGATTYTKVQNFTGNGVYRNCLPDYTNNNIVVWKPGIYRLAFNFSTYTDTNNCELQTCIFINDEEVTQDLHTLRRIINANQASVSATNGLISITGYSTIDIRTRHNLNGDVVVLPKYGCLNLVYINDSVV